MAIKLARRGNLATEKLPSRSKCAQWAHSQLLALALVGYCQETAVAPTKNGIGIGPKIPLARMKCDTRRKRWDKQYILT